MFSTLAGKGLRERPRFDVSLSTGDWKEIQRERKWQAELVLSNGLKFMNSARNVDGSSKKGQFSKRCQHRQRFCQQFQWGMLALSPKNRCQ
jgi:hypothetical protein